MGRGEVGLEADGLADGGDRLLELALVDQGVAEVLVGLGEVGLEADGLAELGLGGGIVVLAVAQDLPRAADGTRRPQV